MRILSSFVRWLILGIVVLGLVVVLGGMFLMKTPYGKNAVRQMAEMAFNRSFQGTLRVERIEAIGLTGLQARGVALYLEGRRVLSADRVDTEISPLALAAKRVWIPRLDLQGVFFDLARDKKGKPAIVRVFEKPHPKPGAPSNLRVRVARVQIQNARLKDASFSMHKTKIVGDVSVFQNKVRVGVDKLISELLYKDKAHNIEASLAYSLQGGIHRLEVFPSSLQTGNSSFGVQGRIRLAPSFRMGVALAIERGFLKDLGHLLPLGGVSLATPIQGGLAFKGDFERFSVFGGMVSSKSRLFGTMKADLKKERPQILAHFSRFEIHSNDLLLPISDASKADFQLKGEAWLRTQGPIGHPKESQAEVSLDQAIIRGVQAERIDLGVKQAGDVILLKAMALDPDGKIDLQGKVTVSKKYPFEASFTFKGLNPSAWYPKLPQSSLFGKGSFFGDLKEQGGPFVSFKASLFPNSSVADTQGVKADIEGTLNPKEVRLASANLIYGPNTLKLSGSLESAKPLNADLAFSLKAKDLSRVSGLFGASVQGVLSSKGKVSKKGEVIRLEGSLLAQKLKYSNFELAGLDALWKGSLERGQPKGWLRANIGELKAGLRLQAIHLRASGGVKPQVSLTAKETRFGGVLRVMAYVEHHKNAWDIGIDALNLKTKEASWKLAQSSRLLLAPSKRFSLSKLELTDGNRAIVLEGGIASEKINGRIDLLRVKLKPLLGVYFPTIRGLDAELNGNFRVLGLLSDPQIRVQARVQDIRMGGKDYGTLKVESSYQKALANLEVSWPSQATLISLRQPMDLSFTKGIRVQFKPGRRLEASSGGLPLRMIQPFVGTWLSHIAGTAKFRLIAQRNTLGQRRIRGLFTVEGGFAKFERLGTELAFDRVRLDFLGTEAKLLLQAHDPDGGSLTLKGKVGLMGQPFNLASLDVTLLAKALSLVRVPRYLIKANANLRLMGNTGSPRLLGELTFLKSLLNPDLGIFAKKGITQDNTIIVHTQEPKRPGESKKGPSIGSRIVEALAVDVRVQIGQDVWVRRTDLTADLGGGITISKEPYQPLRLDGSLEITKGWLNVYSKRFTIERAKAKFMPSLGMNPLLDVIAVYSKGEYTVYIMAQGEAKRPQMEFRSSPELSKQDILSVLLFGKPQDELGASEQASLQAQAASASGGMIASMMLTEIRQEFGLSGLGLQIEEFSLADENGDGGRIGLGRYIGPKTYVRFYHSLNPQEGEEVAIDYHLTPKLGVSGHTTSQGTSGVDVFLHTQF